MRYTLLITLSFLMMASVTYAQKTENMSNIITQRAKSMIKEEVKTFMGEALSKGYSNQKIDDFFTNLVSKHSDIVAKTCEENVIPRGAEIITKYNNPVNLEGLPGFSKYCTVYFRPNV